MNCWHCWTPFVPVAVVNERWHKSCCLNDWVCHVRRDDPNLEYLRVVATALGDLCKDVVFVGGSVAGLLLTDPLAEGIRATKDEAFIGRGGCDHVSSHDLEDILNVVDGRPQIVEELRTASDALQKFVGEQFKTLLAQPNFENYLPGLLTDESRVGIVLSRLRSMTP
jgi:hypothetical protein